VKEHSHFQVDRAWSKVFGLDVDFVVFGSDLTNLTNGLAIDLLVLGVVQSYGLVSDAVCVHEE